MATTKTNVGRHYGLRCSCHEALSKQDSVCVMFPHLSLYNLELAFSSFDASLMRCKDKHTMVVPNKWISAERQFPSHPYIVHQQGSSVLGGTPLYTLQSQQLHLFIYISLLFYDRIREYNTDQGEVRKINSHQ